MSSESKLPQMDLSLTGSSISAGLAELMRAMVLRAVDDVHTKGEFREEAVSWLEAEDNDYILSFRFICDFLGCDYEKTKEAILYPNHRISTRRRAA